ncbi:kif5 [Symbiodinium microadriaticum]|nr:kif5 [Symbiodinium microadriaticum]
MQSDFDCVNIRVTRVDACAACARLGARPCAIERTCNGYPVFLHRVGLASLAVLFAPCRRDAYCKVVVRDYEPWMKRCDKSGSSRPEVRDGSELEVLVCGELKARRARSQKLPAQALQAQRDRRPTDPESLMVLVFLVYSLSTSSPRWPHFQEDLDEQYGKPPPTETPQFATSNVANSSVYKEKMQDLLRPNSEMLRVKELPQRGLFVDGLSREYVTCASDVMAVIRAGLRTRAVGRTRCNNYSSRSHVVFVLHVEQQSLQGEERLGKLTLVDLAGSEKVSKNECVGETFEEAKKINWSLSALGKVIDALAEQRSHVPYRDSKLTRVLQESFKQVTIAENLSTCPKLTAAAPCAFLMGLTQDRGFNRSREEEAEMSRGQPASSSSYWTCQCRVTHNYFVKSVGKHFMYRGDDVEFYRQHGDELSATGCEVADVLADLRRQREERLSAPDRTMQRVDKIAQHYTRLHPEVYVLNAPAFLDPRFLKVVQGLRVSGPAAASIAGLKSEGLLEELRPGIWSFPVFTTAFCDAFESELAHFRASGLPRSAPNTMNRHGVIMSELGFEELLDPLVFEHVNVLASRLLPAFTEFLDSYRGFTVLYEATQDGDKGLAMHYDNAEVTLNVNIGGTWQGGHVAYYGLATSKEALGGNCRTTLLVAASPFSQHADETLSSLRFATRAKSVRNIAKVNYTYSPEQLLVLVGKLHKQLLGANQHIIELGGLPQEAPTHDADKCATLAATSSTRSLRRPSSGKSFFIPEEASSVHGSDSLRPVGIELSEPDLTQAVPGAQKEDDEEEDMEGMSWHLYDEVFKPFALSAQKAMGAMEDALLAQEQALAEVRLRHAQREDAGHDRPTPSYSSSRPGLEEESREANLLSERFRALRHAVESRSLRWRLQVEKHRAEQLVIELQMRDKFQKLWLHSTVPADSLLSEAATSRINKLMAEPGTRPLPCRVVLVEPRDARNVGMVARACANFSVRELVVVHAAKLEAAVSRARRSAEKARQLGIDAEQITEAPSSSSVHCALDLSAWKGCERLATTEGEEVLQSAKLYGNLKAALSGTGLSIAFSGRQGRNFREPTLTLKMLAQKLASTSTAEAVGQVAASDKSGEGLSRQVALVFGSEDVGLSTESVLLCTDVCRLQTGSCPSLNLSHAVAVVLARIFEEVQEEPPSCSSAQATEAADGGVPQNEIPAPVWTSDWSELCRARLEVQGYPAKAELWHGRGRRKCLYTYRLFRVVAECARSLQRTNATDSEVKAWTNLVQSLSQVCTGAAADQSECQSDGEDMDSTRELEESLAEARTRIAEAEELSAARAKASTASSGTGNTPAPRSPPGSSGGNSAASRREKPRIVRPVPRTRNTRGSPTRSKTMSLDVPKEVLSPLVSPNASRIPTPSARAEDVLWVAGTGDTGGEASGSSTLESSCETGALASTSVDAKAQGASMDVDVRASMPGEAVQTDLKQQALLERRSSKLRDLMGELQSKDLQISALRHQIRIKDALLGCLQDEERFRFETLDSELEALLEKALSPLTAILTREQTARTAVATPRPAGPSRR